MFTIFYSSPGGNGYVTVYGDNRMQALRRAKQWLKFAFTVEAIRPQIPALKWERWAGLPRDYVFDIK